jgi:hypothetical protein
VAGYSTSLLFVLNGVSQPMSTVVFAAIDIACGVFSPAAGDYSSKQLDVFVLHDRHLFRKPWLDLAAEC